MDFDFSTYLKQLDPSNQYNLERLTGGVTNVTVRATRDEANSTEMTTGESAFQRGRFPSHSSLILKHAPPYIAGVGDSAPMSQTRQSIEAAALALFLPSPPPPDGLPSLNSLYPLMIESGIAVPTLLHHDPVNHILVLSDLGRLPDLSKIFIELGGSTPDVDHDSISVQALAIPGPYALPLNSHLEDHEVQAYGGIGVKLGGFFAQLHHPDTRHLVTAPQCGNAQVNSVLSVGFPSLPEMDSVVYEHAIKPVREHLLKFPSLIKPEEVDVLFGALEANFLRPTPPEQQCFVLGDSWTGAVLVDLSPDDVPLSVIDWEFAKVDGRGLDGDVSQFLAHLELLRVAALHRGVEKAGGHLTAVIAIMNGFIHEYMRKQARPAIEGVMRSAFLSHGTEIINCAFWKSWVCEDDTCTHCSRGTTKNGRSNHDADAEATLKNLPQDAADEQKLELECNLVTKMVSRGISFLKCAVAADFIVMAANLRQRLRAQGSEISHSGGLCDFLFPSSVLAASNIQKAETGQ